MGRKKGTATTTKRSAIMSTLKFNIQKTRWAKKTIILRATPCLYMYTNIYIHTSGGKEREYNI